MRLKYEGAGILFWRRAGSGGIEVLLGLRSRTMGYAPSVWSTFGGGLKREDEGSFLRCAKREAAEETARNDRGFFDGSSFRFDPEAIRIVKWNLGFSWEFRTYSCEVLASPSGWPSLNGEHEKAEWRNPSSGLPAPTHGEARRAIAALTKRRHSRTK